MVAGILQQAGLKVGLACTDGIYLDGKRVTDRLSSGIGGALSVLTQGMVDVAVLEASRGSLLLHGLAFDKSTVAACTNIANDHLHSMGIETLDQMAEIKRIVVETAQHCTVLNADDRRCLDMRPFLQSSKLCLLSMQADNPEVQEHLKQGGTAVYLQNNDGVQLIMLAEKEQHYALIDVCQTPATWQGKARHNIENAMFAAAICHAMDIPAEMIRRALKTQGTTLIETPGRLNLYEQLPFPIILDYAHNAHGLNVLCRFLDEFACTGRKVLVLFYRDGVREQDILDAAETVAGQFDIYICRDSASPDQEYTGITSNLLKTSLMHFGVAEQHIQVIPEPEKALDYALTLCQKGDLLTYITGPMVFKVWEQLEQFKLHNKSQPEDT